MLASPRRSILGCAPESYNKMRGSSIREVASTHGNISFKDVLLFHQEE